MSLFKKLFSPKVEPDYAPKEFFRENGEVLHGYWQPKEFYNKESTVWWTFRLTDNNEVEVNLKADLSDFEQIPYFAANGGGYGKWTPIAEIREARDGFWDVSDWFFVSEVDLSLYRFAEPYALEKEICNEFVSWFIKELGELNDTYVLSFQMYGSYSGDQANKASGNLNISYFNEDGPEFQWTYRSPYEGTYEPRARANYLFLKPDGTFFPEGSSIPLSELESLDNE